MLNYICSLQDNMVKLKVAYLPFKNLWFRDSFIFWGSVLSLLLIIILVLIILFKLGVSSETAVIHYNVLIGVDSVKSAWHYLLMPIIALLVWGYNLFLAQKFHRFEPFASYQLVIASIAVSAILLGAALALTSLP
jgi:hypothetical protein